MKKSNGNTESEAEALPAEYRGDSGPALNDEETNERKIFLSDSRVMYSVMLGMWGVIVIAAVPFFLSVLKSAESVLSAAVLSVIGISLMIFWLFGLYNIVLTVFGYSLDGAPEERPYTPFDESIAVAIAYPTFNDFSPDHLDKSRRQTHEKTHTYIIDDSTDEWVVGAIDAYARDDPDVTVVRREGREGYKGGALNYALKNVIDEPYFALMDADEILPPDFIEKTITKFTADDIGFVQGNHDYNRLTATTFGRALGIGVDIHWDVYQPPRNKYGFVMLLGHGALIRRDVWETIGGFPEIVSEDLAFATRSREHGYRGVFDPDVNCLEDFPVDYNAFRQRHKKWTAGSIEYIQEELPRFLKSKTPIEEKLDVAIPTFQLPLTVVFIGYIFAVGFLEWTTGTVFSDDVRIPAYLGVVTLATLLSPLYCYMIGLRYRKRKLAHFIATSTTVYCSVAVTAVAHGAKTLFPWERAEFLTTPKKVGADFQLRSYATTLMMGVVTLGISSKAGILVGTAAFTWIIAPLLEMYNSGSTGGKIVRGTALLPFVILIAGVIYGLVIVTA